MNRFVIALLLTLICTAAYADKPRFQIFLFHNGKGVGSVIPQDRLQTTQSAAHHLFHTAYARDPQKRFKPGDRYTFIVAYPKHGYSKHYLYGCFEKVGQFKIVKRPGDCDD